MIAELMIYTTAVSLLVGLAALLVERAVSAPAWPRRWLWAAAMTMSLGGAAAITVDARLRPVKPAIVQPPAMSISRAPIRQSGPHIDVLLPRQIAAVRVDSFAAILQVPLKRSWLGASVLLLGLYVLGGLRLRRARRNWCQIKLDGSQVFVTQNVGPAVVGFYRPVIVVPRWLLDGPPASREIALAHEREHIAARDPPLLLAALLLVALTPWNLPLWWQLRRLKLAIEVDCDRRVLRRGVDRKQYAHTLLQINQRIERMPLAAIAIVGRVSQIERRIGTMLAQRPKNMRLWIAGWAAAAIPLLVAAAEISPPAAPPTVADSGAPHAVLGIGIADFDINGAARALAAQHTGVLVTDVRAGGAAERAGIKRGDVILKYGPTTVVGMTSLLQEIAHTAPDASVPLVIQRGPDVRKVATITLHFSPQGQAKPQSPTKVMDASDWDTLRDASLPIKDRELASELIRISGLDQLQAQQKSMMNQPPLPANTSSVGMAPPGYDPGTAENVSRLKAIIAAHGWPTVSLVGVRGARSAALIAVSSNDPAFKAEALTLMEPLIQRDEVPATEYTWLYDSVHSPQRFGTQEACENGVNKPTKPVEDPEHLDERRAALGLIKLPQFCINTMGAKGRG